MTTYPQPFNTSHFPQYANWTLLQAKNSRASEKPLEQNFVQTMVQPCNAAQWHPWLIAHTVYNTFPLIC